jgi:hypothetical protein
MRLGTQNNCQVIAVMQEQRLDGPQQQARGHRSDGEIRMAISDGVLLRFMKSEP